MIVKIGFGAGFKRVGFDVDADAPKLSANFTTGTYKQDGITKTFADLFTFTRAGKAWLVKESGLQEYAADVPRFDGGLLIEQSATNYWVDSATYKAAPVILESGGIIYRAIGYNFSTYRSDLNISSGDYVISARFANTQIIPMRAILAVNPLLADARIPVSFNEKLLLQQNFTVTSEQGIRGYLLADSISNPDNLPIGIAHGMVQKGSVVTTYIPTPTIPVTRPADFLTNKITGTTVTGDWDSTLTLSIVAGKLVHSGYGKIRSLEIN